MSRVKKVVLLIALLLCFPFISTVQFVIAEEGTWQTMASMPTARSGLGVAVVDGKIYAIGGSTDRWVNVTEEYDPATDTWIPKTSMPTKRGYFATVVHQSKIFVFGGDSKTAHIGINEVYDPLTDTWETRSSMPTARIGAGACVFDGKIYVIGGWTYMSELYLPLYSSVTEIYDPMTDSWTTGASMPEFEGFCSNSVKVSSLTIDNKIHLIIGDLAFFGEGMYHRIYDPETDTWSFGENITTSEYSAIATSGVFAPKRIHVIGSGEHLVYNPQTRTWSNDVPMPISRSYPALAVVDGLIYTIGGYKGTQLDTNEMFTPIGYIPEFPSWIILPVIMIATFLVVILYRRRNLALET